VVVSYTTTLYLLSIEFEITKDFDGIVEFYGKHTNASKAPISVLYFHKSSLWIIVGDQQGNGILTFYYAIL
jgi:hypothetical protein